MNKFLRSVKPSSKKDDLIKKSITTQLSNSVKEIQYANIEENKSDQAIDITEAANQLCNTIEAMFLHGLKDSLTHRFRRAVTDLNEKPEPSFWPTLLVYSHRQIIDQITSLSQIITDVGRCRAWIRLALNDCLLSSYLMTMRRDSSLKYFYRSEAFIRDVELIDVAQRLIEGVEAFKTFTLPFNSSLLNSWPLPSLYLSGIWAPTLKACPVAPCDDVAQSIVDIVKPHNSDSNSDTASINSSMSFNSQSSSLKHMSEDEILKQILSKNKKEPRNNQSVAIANDELKSGESESEEAKSVEENLNYDVGNSLKRQTGWSFDENQLHESELKQDVTIDRENKNESKPMEASYNAIIESMMSRTPDLREVWQKFEDERTIKPDTQEPLKQNESNIDTKSVCMAKTESVALAVQVGKIAKEKGLDVQNYECTDCRTSLDISKKLNVCHFTGNYVCDSCINHELISIPARIIHNWDFKTYPVSKKSFEYINEIKDHPVIDFKVLNPYIYRAIEEMADLQILRNQLNFVRAYLYTCPKSVIEELQKMMWPREYMYEHIHQYSFADLLEIPNNVLATHLKKAIAFGREHVSGCWLCSQKGFVCEVCNKPKALFPFDVENVYRCDVCNGVYHKQCLDSTKPCPKCERRKKREELPLFGAATI